MHRLISFLFGPEAYWIGIGLLVRAATRRTLAPDPAVTSWLDRYWIVLPLMAVPLTFAFFWLVGGSRWWLVVRIDLAVMVGLATATTLYCNGMTYHQPSSGPGAGTAWMMMLATGYLVLAFGTAVAAAIIWWRGRGAG